VALVEGDSQSFQPGRDGVGRQVRAGDALPLAHQKLRQAAHADAAYADEVVREIMYRLFIFH
jgi:hypothetical protein